MFGLTLVRQSTASGRCRLQSSAHLLCQVRKIAFAQYPLKHQQQPPSSETESETHFGYQTVKESEKQAKGKYLVNLSDLNSNPKTILVHKVFEDVAKSYDVMNDAMSLGIHRVWKDVFMERLGPTHGTKLLDMAGGTGNL